MTISSISCSSYSNSSFTILYFNARSLLPKLDFLKVLCAMHTPDCVCIVESWISNDIQNNELCINGYDIIHLDRNRHGGGVLFYIKSVFIHSIVFSGSDELELVIVSIDQTNNQPPRTLALFYRPPSSSYSVLDSYYFVYICKPTMSDQFYFIRRFQYKLF